MNIVEKIVRALPEKDDWKVSVIDKFRDYQQRNRNLPIAIIELEDRDQVLTLDLEKFLDDYEEDK